MEAIDLTSIDIDKNTKLLIFSIEKNSFLIDSSIIPMEQLQKIERFKDPKDRIKRLLSRCVLFHQYKTLFSLKDFSFIYTDRRRPRFKESSIDFNLSYSNDLIAIAISTIGSVGLDIEYMDDSVVCDNTAFEFMDKNEFSTFVSLEKEQKIKCFYESWTSKESFLKASGDGLYIDPKTITNNLGKRICFNNYVINIVTK